MEEQADRFHRWDGTMHIDIRVQIFFSFFLYQII